MTIVPFPKPLFRNTRTRTQDAGNSSGCYFMGRGGDTLTLFLEGEEEKREEGTQRGRQRGSEERTKSKRRRHRRPHRRRSSERLQLPDKNKKQN